MSDFRLLMTQQEIAEEAGISQQMVNSVTAKLWITSLNLHLTPPKRLGTQCGSWSSKAKEVIRLCNAQFRGLAWTSNHTKPMMEHSRF